MYQLSKARGCNIFPPYSALQVVKSICNPTQIEISENIAQVSMQNLLDHTAEQILVLQKEVISQMENVSRCKLIVSYGFDGSTGQSLY